MAKQSGIHQLQGKVKGMSYYRQKGVTNGLARSINEGMSERVKTSAAYYNTRLNAVEFGTAGSFSGAAIRAISDRQRTMLKDFSTGFLAKAVRDIITGDTVNPWGQRTLEGTDWQKEMLSRISSYAKLDFNTMVGGTWGVTVTKDATKATWTPNAELPAGWGADLAAQGADGAYIEMYAYSVQALDLGVKSKKGYSFVGLIGKEDSKIGEAVTITKAATTSLNLDGTQKSGQMQGVLVVVKPYQTINAKKYIRQELCTFLLQEVTIG